MNNENRSFSSSLSPRQFMANFSENTPRHWLPDNPVISAILNTYSVLVPANEGFYIRTLKLCMPKVREASTRWMIVDFVHQEAQHGVGHRSHWNILDLQGYKFRRFERLVDKTTFRVVERVMPLSIRVSIVSCIEHINAYLAHEFLKQGIIEAADPHTRALFEWHFAEEIEHKHVAYRVLKELSGSYAVRLIGALLAAPLFYLLMTLGMMKFLNQDGLLLKKTTWKMFIRHMGRGHRMATRTLRHLIDYLRPGFDPWQLDDKELADRVIKRYCEGHDACLKATARSRQGMGSDAEIDIASKEAA